MSEEAAERGRGWLHRLVPVVMLLVFCAALWALHREMAHFNFEEFRAYLRGLSWGRLGLALAATLGGYAALVGYDFFLRFAMWGSVSRHGGSR
ncbi:MAG: hypothetical protein O3A87_03220 [Verrucomicrobia bacterium]|nr:hypothetical protein [Verrucomicrobiota bacterium]MDA1005474.1 hypothetical protein [Verrucomicrobiota bacterium]